MWLLVTKPGFELTPETLAALTDADVDYYCSMYPNELPTRIKKLVMGVSSKSVGLTVAPSYVADILMRGSHRELSQSYRKDKSVDINISAADSFNEQGDLTEKDREQWFRLGQYDYAVTLPDSFHIGMAIQSLNQMRGGGWTVYAPVARYINRRSEGEAAHNCSSALVRAFEVGGLQITPRYALTQASPMQRNAFWVAFVAIAVEQCGRYVFTRRECAESAVVAVDVYVLSLGCGVARRT